MAESITEFTVTGMTCGHCVGAVKAELEQVAGVDAAEVDLATGKVSVSSSAPVERASLVAAVEEAGYAVTPAGS
ncbi:MAG: cation transporter [Microthrixaceae bacterium]